MAEGHHRRVEMPRTLVLTGHFPPEPGGVQTLVREITCRLPADRLLVVAPAWPGAAAYDAGLPFPVVRRRGYLLQRDLPGLVRRHGCTAAWIPAAAPFGLFVPALRRAGIGHVVASTQGQELGWLRAAPTRVALRRIAGSVDVLTHLTQHTRTALLPVVERPQTLHHLPGGVDVATFRPGGGDPTALARLGLAGHPGPTVVCVSRLVRRKGQDRLMQAWPRVLREFPDARLVLVGEGPLQRSLTEAADRAELRGSVRVPGGLPLPDVVACLAAADVFVMPCRDARRGLQTEGLGLAALEASAVGVPVVVGRSGGTAEALVDGVTGVLVCTQEPAAVAEGILGLLRDPQRADRMGRAGHEWVRRAWTWEHSAQQLRRLLDSGVDRTRPAA